MNKFSRLLFVYKQFWKQNTFLSFSFHSFFVILFFVRILLSNSPVFVNYKGEKYWLLWDNFPRKGSLLQQDLLEARYEWGKLQYDKVVWPIYRLSEETFNTDQQWRAPLTKDTLRFHLLGTYELGRDVLSSCLFGMQKSMAVAFLSILIAILIGLPLGVAGYFYSLQGVSLGKWATLILVLSALLIVYILLLCAELKFIPIVSVILILFTLCLLFYFVTMKQEKFLTVNTDYFLLRFIELIKSLPLLLILLLVLQWFKKPDLLSLAILIGLFMSVSIAKYARFITLSESKENYVQSFTVLGYSNSRIVIIHLIPKVLKILTPLIALSIGSIILLESSISFLGLGLPIEEVSLGSMMQSAKNYPSAWWVVLFPGLCIFWLVFCFQSLNAKNLNKEAI